MTVRKATVPRGGPQQKLEAFLKQAFPGVSTETARRLIAEGRVRVGGRVPKAMRKLWGGEELEVDFPDAGPAPATQGPRLRALFEDERFVVVDKPAGLVVEPEGRAPSVVGLAASQFKGIEVGGKPFPGVAHRLDRGTTGCLALAKTDEALVLLRQAFVDKRVVKRYLALALGRPPVAERLEGPYGRNPADPRKFTTRHPSARRAALSFRRLELFPTASLLEVTLETGRTHQIRVQLSEAGHPLVGDAVYGLVAGQGPSARETVILDRPALHAQSLHIEFPAPIVPIRVTAALPEDFQRALKLLRGEGATAP